MAYTKGAYLKVNQGGLITSAICEEGFNKRFKSETGQEEFSKIEFKDINKPNTTVEEIIKESLELPTVEKIVNIGSEKVGSKTGELKYGTVAKKGIFCEKPALTVKSDAYFFPLGSNGLSLDTRFKSKGFKLSEFLKGGIDELERSEFKGQTLQEVPLSNGYICNEIFDEDSDYDEKCFFNYEGAHITSDSSKYNNLLKFGEDSKSFKPIIVEKRLQAGDYLNYSCSTKREIYGVWSVSIINKDTGEPFTDYSVKNTSIVSNNPLTEDTTLVLKIRFHSAFRRRKATSSTSAGIDWTGLCNCTLDIDDIVRDNLLQAEDAINIPVQPASVNGRDVTSVEFNKEVSIEEEGNYYISAYMRTVPYPGVQAKVRMYFLKEVEKEAGETEEKIPFSPCIYSDVQYNEEESSFLITPTWRRISTLTNIQEPGKYRVIINVKALNTDRLVPGIRVVGAMVSKNELPPYDYKNINYTNISNENLAEVKKHILCFDFSKAVGEMSKENSWIVSYLRKFEGLSEDNQEHYDTIGNVTFGYKGDKVVVNNEPLIMENFKANNTYNGWEQVIISHEKGEENILVEVTTVGNDSKSAAPRASRTYSFTSPIEEYTLKIPHTQNGKYNLILGGKVVGTEILRSNGSYRNLWWFPEGLTDKEKQRLKSQFISYSQIKRTKIDETIEENVLIRGDFLQENTNY